MSAPEPIAPRYPHERASVSALFDHPDAVDEALLQLNRAGVPRDLIEVVVSPEAAQRFYPDRARGPGRDMLRYAGIGGLVGLVFGAVLSLILIAIPGFFEPGGLAFVQLLGPNFMTVSGAVLGAVVGFFAHRRAERRWARAVEAPSRIVVLVITRSEEEAHRMARLLERAGGHDARREE